MSMRVDPANMQASMKISVEILPSCSKHSRRSIQENVEFSSEMLETFIDTPFSIVSRISYERANLVMSLSTPNRKSSDGPYMASIN